MEPSVDTPVHVPSLEQTQSNLDHVFTSFY